MNTFTHGMVSADGEHMLHTQDSITLLIKNLDDVLLARIPVTYLLKCQTTKQVSVTIVISSHVHEIYISDKKDFGWDGSIWYVIFRVAMESVRDQRIVEDFIQYLDDHRG